MEILDEIEKMTRDGKVRWKPTGEVQRISYSNGMVFVPLVGYRADFNGCRIETIARKGPGKLKDALVLGVTIENNDEDIVFVQNFYEKDQFAEKQIKTGPGEVISFMVAIHSSIRAKKLGGDLS